MGREAWFDICPGLADCSEGDVSYLVRSQLLTAYMSKKFKPAQLHRSISYEALVFGAIDSLDVDDDFVL